jgi:hypothetical protein
VGVSSREELSIIVQAPDEVATISVAMERAA